MNQVVVWLNGDFIPAAEARIGVYDAGWLHGAGLFETIRAEQGRPFRLTQHLNRLCASAEKLLTALERACLPTQDVIEDLLKRNALREARVRLTVSAGEVRDADAQQRVTVCVTAVPLAAYPASLYDAGLVVCISKYRQSRFDPLAGHKTTNFLGRLVAMKEAGEAGCGEALWFTPQNLLAEGSISNVFVVKSGVVTTPPHDTPVLPGIARAAVLELCADEGIETREQPIDISSLLDADEVFLTNSIMQVMPVRTIERRDIAAGKPAPITRRLLDLYRALVRRECAVNP